MIDTIEHWCVATCDVPGAFMQVNMDKKVHMKLEGELAELLFKVDSAYAAVLTYEQGKPVINTKLDKALYGTLQATLLFWKCLTAFFNAQGFTANPYDTIPTRNG